jgi:hypothetical protein
MTSTRRLILAGAVVGSMLGSGVAGAAIATALNSPGYLSLAASNTPASPAPGQAPNGKFVPNEDPTHEQGESAAREAQENAGRFPTVP